MRYEIQYYKKNMIKFKMIYKMKFKIKIINTMKQ